MSKSITTIGKKLLACACSVALGTALVPAAALAADGGNTNEPVVLQVQMQDQKTGQVLKLTSKKYTASTLEELASANTTTASYLYNGKSGANVISTSSYVKLSQLVGDIDKWGAGASLSFETAGTGEDGTATTIPYTKATVSYEEATQTRYFYPEYSATADYSNAVTVEPVVALKVTGSKTITSTAADIVENLEADSYGTSDAPRFLMGSTSGELIAGKYFPSNVATITVVYPHKDFQIVAKNAETGATTPMATYSDEALAKLAEANTEPMNFILKSGVHTASKYVTVKQLLGSSAYWTTGSSATFTAVDGFSYTLSYEDANTKQYFYPSYSSTEQTDFDQVEVEPVLAIEGKAGTLGEATAKDALETLTTDNGMPRFFKGNTDVKNLLVGKTSPQALTSITVNYNPSEVVAAATEKIDSLEAELETAKADAAKAAENAKADASAKAKEVKELQGQITAAKAEAAAAKAALAKTVKTVTVNAKTVDAAVVKAAISKAGGNAKYVTSITLGKNVKTIKAGAFKGLSKVKTVTIKTTKLTKKSVKGSLKGSNVKTVKVAKSKVKAYKKIFTKANAGKKVTVKK